MNQHKEGLFATREQELLLQAAHLQGADAITAWQEWKSQVDLEGHLDLPSYRLLPLLYTNLLRNKVDDQSMNKLKGIYRKTWYENQKMFHYIGRIVRYLQDAGIQIILLKGAALTLLYYKNYGVRPMADIDVLVPFSQASPTINLLKKAGWETIPGSIEDSLRYSHSRPFYDNSGRVLDLHWRLLVEAGESDSISLFGDGAVAVRLHDIATYALNPTDTLLHVIVHGVSPHGLLGEINLRWIPDALSIINDPNATIDWASFVSAVKKYRVVFRVKEAVNYLRTKYQARIPESIVMKINRLPVSGLEHMEYQYMMTDGNAHANTIMGGFPLYLCQYLRLTQREGLLAKVAGLPRYLQYRTHQGSLRRLGKYMASRSARILKKKVSRGWVVDGSG